MSDGYREDTRDEFDYDEGDHIAQTASNDAKEFSEETLMEEIGKFKNFNLDGRFSVDEWYSFSPALRAYISAWRVVRKAPTIIRPKITDPDVISEFEPLTDANVTVRQRTSARVEHKDVDINNEDVVRASTLNAAVDEMTGEDVAKVVPVVKDEPDVTELDVDMETWSL